MATKKSTKPFFKEWLEKLQQESWQLELLISGVAIFAILETIKYFDKLTPFLVGLSDVKNGISFALLFGFIFLQAGIYIFLLNLIIHVLVRSLWIGAIGLRYVSGDIDYEQLKYSDKFTQYYKKKIGSFDNYIEKLEDFSSVLFSYTFLLFFILFSFLIGMIAFSVVAYSSLELLPRGNWFNTLVRRGILFSFLGFGLLVAFDFITLGLLKRIKNTYFSAFYLPVYRFFSVITLSFLWRPMLLNFLDQKYTRRLFILIIPYLVLLLLVFQSSYVMQGFYPNFQHNHSIEYPHIVDKYGFNFQYYDEERAALSEHAYERIINSISIPSKKVNGPLGEIFIKGSIEDKYLINQLDSTLTAFEEDGLTNELFSSFQFGIEQKGKESDKFQQIKLLKDSIKDEKLFEHLKDSILNNLDLDKKEAFRQKIIKVKNILQSSILIYVDDKKVNPGSITCDFYLHPDASTKGLLCFFPLDSLTIGRHEFKVSKVKGIKESSSSKEILIDTVHHHIPFIYTGNH